MDTIIFF